MKNFIQNRIKSLAIIALYIAVSPISFAAELDETCVVNILNRTIQVAPNGGWSLPNVPSNQGAVRARATCIDQEGATVSGQSGYFNLITNGITPVGDIFFAEQEPAPSSIRFASVSQISLTSLGQSYQMEVTAVYPNGLTDVVTSAEFGVNYTSSNPAVVNITENGLLTARGSGNSLITANKDGVVATRLVKVSFTGDQDGDGLPDDYETDNGLDPTDPADAFEDRDNDGLSALDEYLAGTDLNKADTDDDGINDNEELNEGEDGYITNPLLADTDADGLSDLVEITLGSAPNDANDANYEDAITSLTVIPANILMTFNGIDSEVSTQLQVIANIIGGEQLNVTAKSNGTTYKSNDLTVVSFGLTDGEVFGGEEGQTTVTVSLFDLSIEVPVTVQSFQPKGISSLSFTGTGQDTDVQGDFVYIAANTAGLHVVNAGVKETPELIATLPTTAAALDVKVVGNVAYVAVGNSGLDIIDITDPAEPSLLANIATAGKAVDLAVQNGYVFIAGSLGGFEIISVLDPSEPIHVAKLEGLGNIIGVDVQNDRAVVATSSSVIVIDISDLLSPMRLGSINIGNVRAVVMDGNYAYVACYTCGYKIINIENPQLPRIVGGDTRFYPSDVERTNGFAFFSDILFVNAVPFVNIANPEDSIFQGVIDIRQFGDRDATGLSLDAGFVYSTGYNKLYISQYRILDDNQGVEPSVTITHPNDGEVVVEGSRIILRADASDDIAVATVNFFVNDELILSDTTRPYEVPITVPSGADELNIVVVAVDFGNNQGDNVALLTVEPDEDNDGLGDNEEVFTWNTDPNDSDSDDDGLLDGEEIELGTNPLNADSDSDERSDGDEVAAGTDPLNPDVTAPVVTEIDPLNESTEICENQSISISFNEALLRASLNSAMVILSSETEPSVDGILSLNTNNTQLLFNPSNLLKDNTEYQLSISNVRDSAGNLLAETFTSSFSTGNCVDLDRPFVVDISPINGSNNIPVNAEISVILSEPIDPLTVTTDTFYVVDQSSSLRVGGTITLSDDNSAISFTPDVPFLVGRRHYVYLTSNILDLFGNRLSGISRYFDTAFELDGDGPQVVSTTVSDGDVQVPTNTKLAVLFDEAINALYLNQIKLVDAAGVTIATTRELSSDRRRVILTPVQTLATEVSYTFWVDGVQDLSGNLLANSLSFSFTTGTEADVETGSVSVWSIPRNNTQNVSLNPVLQVEFSERIDPTTINNSSVRLYDNQTRLYVTGETVLAASGKGLTFVPDKALRENRTYYFQIGYSPYLTDLAGNLVATNQYRYFQTGLNASSDDLAPNIVASNIMDGNANMPINGKLELVFNEEIGGQCNLSNAVKLYQGDEIDAANQVSAQVTLDNNRKILTIVSDELLATETSYQLVIENLCDYAGNIFSSNLLSFTTVASESEDNTGPSLVSISPAASSTDISVTTSIVMTYDEPLDLRSAPPILGGGITVPGEYVVDGNTITFTPEIELLGNTRYTVDLRYNAVDLAGNSRWNNTRYFDTQATTDTQAPNILAISPAADSTDVYPTQTIVVSFDEPMNLSTLTADNIALYHNGNVINPTIFRSADGREISLSTTLPSAAVVSLVMTDGVTDLSDNAMAPFVVSFTTSVLDNDVTRPSIVEQIPANGSSNWSDLDSVYFYVSEPIDASSLDDAFHLAENGILADVDIEVLGDGKIIKVNKAGGFIDNALVQVYWDNNATDIAGNQLNAYSGYFSTADPNDGIGTRARATSYFPSSSTRGLPLNPVLTAKFSEPLDEASLNDSTVILYDITNGSAVLDISYQLDDSEQVIQVMPTALLNPDHEYYLWFSVAILDQTGDNLAGNYATYFYTDEDSVEDDRQPMVLAFNPPTGEMGVGTNALFSLTFDEMINPLSFARGGAINVQFDSNNTRVKYNQLTPLEADAEITENVPLITDLAGLQPVAQSVVFNTASGPDLIRPTVVDTAISNNQQNIGLNPIFDWQFSEAIDSASVNSSGVYLYDAFDGQNIASTFELSSDGKKLTIVPSEPLLVGRQYYQYAYGLRDLSGNTLGNHYRYFTTGFEPDITPPVIISSTVYEGLTQVPINVKLNVRFNESLNPVNQSGIKLLDSNGESVAVNITLNRARQLITIVPKQLLSASAEYQLVVEGMTDTSGNEQSDIFSVSFTTGTTADFSTGGIVRWSIPNNNTSNVVTNVWLQVDFNEAVDPATFDSSSFYLRDTTTNDIIPGRIVVADDRMSVRFVPDELLAENHVHYFYVGSSPYITDWAGNIIARNNYRYFTTGSNSDTDAPTVSATNILSGDTNMPVNGKLLITLDEPVNGICLPEDVVSISQNGENVAINVNLTDANNNRRTLEITAQDGFMPSTEYSVSIDGLCDYAFNQLTTELLSFTTTDSDIADTSAPSFVSISPEHQAVDVAVDLDEIVITLSEAVDVRAAPPITGAGITVPGEYQVNGNVITFTPSINLQGNTRYTVELQYNAIDLAGNRRWLGNKYFDTQDASDLVAPNVLAISPEADAVDISPNQVIVVSFDEPMNVDSLSKANLALYHDGSVINPNIFRSADGQQLTLSAALPANALISLVMTDGITDLSGNALSPFISSFTTGPAHRGDDLVHPAVVKQVPANGSRDWLGLNQVIFYFSEPMLESSLVDSVKVAEDGVLANIDLNLLGDGKTLIVSKAGGFNANSRVDFYLDNQATDESGNALNNYSSYILTGDDSNKAGVRPRITAYYPTANTNNIPLNPTLTAKFDEQIDPASLTAENIILYDITASSAVLSTELSLDATGTVVKVVPDEALVTDNQYYLWFSANILDTDGDQLNRNSAIYLYTDENSALDDRAPMVISMSPPNGETQVGINAQFAARFDETINPLLFDVATNRKVNVQFSETNKVVKYNHLDSLAPNSEITETLADVSDTAGNMIASTSSTFNTAAGPDFTAPNVLDIALSNNQQNVPLAPIVQWIFDEPIDPVSVTDSGVYMRNTTTGNNIASSNNLSADGKRLTIIADELLEEASQYYVYAYYMRDLSGNNLGNHYRYFTTGFAEDETGPVIESTSVFDGQINVPINTHLKVRFNEILNPVNTADIRLVDGAGVTVPTHISLSRSRTLLSLVPKSLLLAETEYTLIVANTADMSGNLQAADLSISFTTGQIPDLNTGSVVTWSIPNNNTRNVALNPLLEVSFSERIDRTTIDQNTFYLRNATSNTIVEGSWGLTADGLRLTFTPDELLTANNTYYLYVGYSPYLTDLAANQVARNNYRYFITGDEADSELPAVSSVSIAQGSNVIPVNARIVLTLTEPLSDACLTSDNLTLTTNDQAVEINASLQNDRQTIVVKPLQNLATSSNYKLAINTLCDYSGNQLTGDVVSFNTLASASEDTSAPTLISISPAANAVDVSLSTTIVLEYNESVDLRAAPPVKAGSTIIPGSYNVNGNLISFTPDEPLTPSTLYTVELYHNIPDFVGNTANGSYRRFTTAAE